MQDELKTLQKSLGITFVFVTHDQGEALSMADRVAVFNEGRIEQVGYAAGDLPAAAQRASSPISSAGSNVIAGARARQGAGSAIHHAREPSEPEKDRAASLRPRRPPTVIVIEAPCLPNALSGRRQAPCLRPKAERPRLHRRSRRL